MYKLLYITQYSCRRKSITVPSVLILNGCRAVCVRRTSLAVVMHLAVSLAPCGNYGKNPPSLITINHKRSLQMRSSRFPPSLMREAPPMTSNDLPYWQIPT